MAKVLIVDDDPDIVEATKMVLESAGHKTDFAHNRIEGMKKVDEYDPDLLILDVMMEEVDDGLVMARNLRRKGFKKPILMLTSINQSSGLEYGKDEEMVPVDDFQQKPIMPSDLLEKIEILLKKKEA